MGYWYNGILWLVIKQLMGYWISKILHLWTNTWLERRSKRPGSLVGAYLWRPGHGFWCRNQERQGVTEIKRLRATFLRLTLALINTIETYHLKLKLGLNSVILFWDPVVFSQQDLNNFWLPVTHSKFRDVKKSPGAVQDQCLQSNLVTEEVQLPNFSYVFFISESHSFHAKWKDQVSWFFMAFLSCWFKTPAATLHLIFTCLSQKIQSNIRSFEQELQFQISQADLWTSSPLFNDIFRTRKISRQYEFYISIQGVAPPVPSLTSSIDRAEALVKRITVLGHHPVPANYFAKENHGRNFKLPCPESIIFDT